MNGGVNISTRPKIGIIGLSGQSIFMTVDHFHQKGETMHAKTFFAEPGGKGYNQAVAAARLGGDVFYLSAVGDDEYADICEKYLTTVGVDFKLIRKENVATAYATILTDRNGENQVTVFPGASELLNGEDVLAYKDRLKLCNMLLLQLEVDETVIEAAVSIAEEYRIPVILNPAPAKKLDLGILKKFLVITPNEQEAQAILGLDGTANMKDIAAAFYNRGICKVVVTLGSRGCLVIDDMKLVHILPIDIHAVDTTGAGDVFNAALAVRLAAGDSLIAAARFATVASGMSVQNKYVLNSIPMEKDVIMMSKSYAPCLRYL